MPIITGNDSHETLMGSDGDDSITGAGGNDRVITLDGNDSISGGDGNDSITGGAGNDSIDGGAGVDIAMYGSTSSVFISRNSNGMSVAADSLGEDMLVNVERLKFVSYSIAYDVSDQGGQAGEVAKILGAVFGAAAVSNRKYAGIGLHYNFSMSYEELAEFAVQAAGKRSHGDIVELLWKNVVGTPITEPTKAHYVALLDGGMSVGALTVMAADTTYNAANINLVGLAKAGLYYTEFVV